MVDPFDPRKVLNSIGGWGPSGTATTTGGPGTGTPPPPPPGGSTAVTYSTYTAPNGPMGASLPSGTIYTVGSNGSFAVDYRPSTSGGGSTGVSVSLNPDSTSAWSIRTIGGRDYRVNELTGEVVPLDVPGGQSSGRDPSGYDPSTGLPYGVVRVNTDVSPTGLVYQGVPVNPDGSRYAGSTSQVANYTGIKEGPGGLWGLNTNTGTYELIPGSEKLGKSTGPATYSGGGGYQIPRDYVGEAKAKGEAGVAIAQAEGAARAAVAQAEAQAQMQRDAAQYGFTKEQSALQRAFQAAQQAWQSSVTNRQLQQQDEAAKRAAANDFRSAVSDTDPIAFAALMKGWGNLENAIRGGGTAVTDRALGGAAGLLDLIRRPFNPIPGFTWSEPTGTFVPNGTAGGATGATAGGAGTTIPGLTTGGSGGAASPGTGGETGVADQGIPMSRQEEIFQQLQNLHSVGYSTPPTPEQIALFWNISQGRGMDPLVTGNYSGIWQSVDPSAPNWRPPYKGYEIPGFTYNWETNQNEPAGQYGRDIAVDVAPTTPVNTPLVPGTPVPPGTIIPGLARGGMARGAFVVGEGSRSNPSEHSELVIAPQGAHVVPLDKPQAKRLLNGGLRSYADGTDPFAGMDWWSLQQANEANAPTFQVGVDSQPFVDAGAYGTRAQYIAPQPTYTPPQVVADTGPSSIGSVSTPYQGAQDIRSTGSTSPPPQQIRADTGPSSLTNTTNTAAVATTPTTSTATPTAPAPVPTTVSGLVNYRGQEITPDYQALLDEIRNFRTDPTANVYDRTLNPMDISFNNLDPISQEVFYKGRQAEFGVPVLAQQWEQNRFRLPGLSRANVRIGY